MPSFTLLFPYGLVFGLFPVLTVINRTVTNIAEQVTSIYLEIIFLGCSFQSRLSESESMNCLWILLHAARLLSRKTISV